MAIDFKRTQTAAANNNGAAGSKEERPKSEFWLNIGYYVEVQVTSDSGEQTTEKRFVSLPVGLPLDIASKTTVKGNDPEFVALQNARNELLEQLIEHVGGFKPGETGDVNLVIQARRINGAPPVIETKDNPFSKKLAF